MNFYFSSSLMTPRTCNDGTEVVTAGDTHCGGFFRLEEGGGLLDSLDCGGLPLWIS